MQYPRGLSAIDWPNNNDCYIKFEGMMVEMLCEIDPTNKGKISYTRDKWRKFLYGKLVRAVYATILGTTLFYNNLFAQIKA